MSFAECAVDMRIGQWVVWFHLRTLCARNGLDLSTLIHWISTGLGWDYSDSEILDTRPSVSLPPNPLPLYQIRTSTNSDLRPSFRNLFLLLFLLFLVFSNPMLAMSIFEFFLSGVSFVKSHYALLWSPNCLLTAPLAADEARDGELRYRDEICANTGEDRPHTKT